MNLEGHYCSSMNCSFSRRLEVAESHVSFSPFLAASRPFRAVVLALEVNPTNERAKNLYESIGF